MSSSERFGYEWDKYRSVAPYKENYKNQFLNWVSPLTPDFFKGKKILDAGCGMGRNSYWPLLWGAAEVVAFDKDERSVKAARENLAEFQNVKIVAHDIYNLPWENYFDFAFSIGVIHHLKEPKKAIAEIARALKSDGELLIWVYGSEGFEKILTILNPIRRHLTSKLPLPLLHLLSYVASIPFFVFLRIIPQRKLYFKQLRTFSFLHLHSIIFDQLLPDVANYFSQDEARDLLSDFRDVTVIHPPNQNGWIVRGVK